MYQDYFGLVDAPFSIAPDPRYLYLSQRHQEALAHLLYGVSSGGGFVLLTGEVGAGKTTVCRCLLGQIPKDCDVAYIFNPKLTVGELLATICTEFGISCPSNTTSVKVYVDHINAYLLDAHANGRHTVMIIDEAQNLSVAVLEQMRLLTNLETNQRKLLQIILLGQSELGVMLARPELRQLSQRIVARYHLGPLSKLEVAAYVRHRLQVSGTQRQLFSARLLRRIFHLSEGIPRVINVLCDRALLGTYVGNKTQVSQPILAQAAREVLYQMPPVRRSLVRPLLVALIVIAGSAGAWLAIKPAEAEFDPLMVQSPRPSQAINATPVALVVPMSPPTNSPTSTPAIELIWPADQAILKSKEIASGALLGQWGQPFAGGELCREANSLGLRCYAARGGLNELRQFNRPAILTLRDNRGNVFHATLTALDETRATFDIAGSTLRVPLSALASQWAGYFTILLRSHAELPAQMHPGDRGAAVQWLADKLALVAGKEKSTDRDMQLDENMIQQVRDFQLSQGITPDGSLGSKTLVRLIREADITAPRLIASNKASQ